jgi:hypothetical protein
LRAWTTPMMAKTAEKRTSQKIADQLDSISTSPSPGAPGGQHPRTALKQGGQPERGATGKRGI